MNIVERGICRSFNETHDLEAGSVIEEIQNCHIGIYMEGYLTHGNGHDLCFCSSSEPFTVAFLRWLEKGLNHTSNFLKNY